MTPDAEEEGCWCMSVSCPHCGVRCGRPTGARSLKASLLLENSPYPPETKLGICNECWARLDRYE